MGNIGEKFFFQTTLNAPNGRVIAVDILKPDKPIEIIPEQKMALDLVGMAKDAFIAVYVDGGVHAVKIFDLAGQHSKDIPLPGLGKVESLSTARQENSFLLSYQDFLTPTSVYASDVDKEQLKAVLQPNIQFDKSKYETKRMQVRSKDGTDIPFFIIHKKGLKLNGKNPTIMTGYGGFALNCMPAFFQARFTSLYWLEKGGVFVSTVLRGGSEFGVNWHEQGKLSQKQNVFDDFVAVARWLIDANYTNKNKLGIIGSSNGGLLTSAVMIQNPELFGAVISQVPVIDMLRYRKFPPSGIYWTQEYGDAENSAKEFKYLYAYSPLHNVKKGTIYPPVLVTTADHDDIVFPAHAEKFVATLQANGALANPIILKMLPDNGHGFAGMSVEQIVDLQTDQYAFFTQHLMSPGKK